MRCLLPFGLNEERRNQRGQVVVELALVFSLLLLLGLGIAEIARALLDVHQLTQSAREGARVASLTPALNSAPSMARVKSKIEKVLQVLGKDTNTVKITITPVDLGGDGKPDIVDVKLEEEFKQIAPVSLIPGMNKLTLQAIISMPLFMPQETS